jgi:copper(I)-binding protein
MEKHSIKVGETIPMSLTFPDGTQVSGRFSLDKIIPKQYSTDQTDSYGLPMTGMEVSSGQGN